MSDRHTSYLRTYPHRFLEEHTDSSDFDDIVDTEGKHVNVNRIKKNKLLLNKELLRKIKLQHNENYNRNENVTSHEKKLLGKKVQVPDKRHRINNIESAERLHKSHKQDYVLANHSTSELHLRNKATKIPKCSNYNDKLLSPIKEKHITNDHKDNSCQVYSVHCNNDLVRFKSMKEVECGQFAYERDFKKDEHFKSTKVVNYSWPRRALHSIKESETSSNKTMTIESSISSEIDNVTLDNKSYVNSRHYGSYNSNISRYSNEKQNKIDMNYKKNQNYQVFSAPQNANIGVCTSFNCEIPKSEIIPARSSLFWDYVANKIQHKSRHEGDICSKPCRCSDFNERVTIDQPSNSQDPYDANAIIYDANEMSRKSNRHNVKCGCAPKPQKRNRNYPSQPYGQPQIPKFNEEPLNPNYYNDNTNMYDESIDNEMPCQRDHDTVTKALKQKYNGEILCIHNPPCILVNGCLKIPQKEETSPTWFVTQDTKPSYYQHNNKQTAHLKNHQQQSKYINIMQYYSEQDKIEREIQSSCQHQPPCKFVRQCFKPKQSSKLDHFCVHVPMCKKMSQCILDTDNYKRGYSSCNHKPKCVDLPMCARDYFLHGEVPNVESEVKKHVDLVCHHQPQCIKIPRCLARMMCDGNMPYSAIPDCTHDPPCEIIPACYRRTPKMVSTYSQYPAPCRIV